MKEPCLLCFQCCMMKRKESAWYASHTRSYIASDHILCVCSLLMAMRTQLTVACRYTYNIIVCVIDSSQHVAHIHTHILSDVVKIVASIM